MRRWIVPFAVLIVVFALPTARAQDNTFKIYAAYNYVSPTGSTDLSIDNVVDRVEASEEAGWSVGIEFRFNKWAGLELDYLEADQDIEFGGVTVAKTSISPISASFNFHLIHTRFVDFYLGPTASYVRWDDLTDIETGEKLSTDDEWGYGAQVGVDFSIIKTVAIVVGLRYEELDLTVEDETLSVNPLYSKVGVAFRF